MGVTSITLRWTGVGDELDCEEGGMKAGREITSIDTRRRGYGVRPDEGCFENSLGCIMFCLCLLLSSIPYLDVYLNERISFAIIAEILLLIAVLYQNY